MIEKWKQQCGKIAELLLKHWWKLLIAVNVIVVLVVGIRCCNHVNHLYSLSFGSEELVAFSREDSVAFFGGKIDESFTPGLYDLYPETMLREGCYEYEVSYTSTSAESFGWPHSYVEYYDAFDADTVTNFVAGEGSNRDIFWMNIDLHMTFRVYYDGVGDITFHSITVRELPYGAYKDAFFSILLLILVDMLVCYGMLRKKHPISDSTKYVICGIFALSLIASFPMLSGYMINGHDIDFHLVRIEGLKEALLSGQFPVRINPEFYYGYGYANPIFYGEVLLYIPAFLRMVGFSLTESYLILVGFLNFLTACICYISVKGMVKNPKIAFVGTVLYTLAPYRLMDTYLRAAIGEVSAMAFLPLVIYGMYRIYTDDMEQKEYRWSFLPLLIGLTGVLQSHVLTGEMVAIFILITCVLLLPKTIQMKRFLALVKTAVSLVVVNLWFLIPFVDFTLTQDLRVFSDTKLNAVGFVQGTGAYLVQLLYTFYRYAWNNFSNSNIISDEMPLTLGIPLVIGLFLCLAMVWSKGDAKKRKTALIVLALAVISTWMATIYFPWDKFSSMHSSLATLISSIQFTWRFLSPATALATVATCIALALTDTEEKGKYTYIIGAVLCTVTLISGMHFMQQCFNNQPPVYREDTTGMDTRGAASGGEYVLTGADYHTVTNVREPIPSEDCVVLSYEKQGTTFTMEVANGNAEGYVLLPLLHYKGYGATSEDGLITDDSLETGNYDVIKVNLPANYIGKVEVRYEGMWYYRVGEFISLAAFVWLTGSYIWQRRNRVVTRDEKNGILF